MFFNGHCQAVDSEMTEVKESKDEEGDAMLHFKVTRFMFESSIKLKLNSVTLASACVLYHRFFQACSPKDYDPYTIGATAIFLATKTEEQHTRLRDVVNVCHRTLFPKKPVLVMSRELWDFKDTIANCELLMLRMLKFRVMCDHPHKYMLHYVMSLSQLFNRKDWERHSIPQTAWALLRDLYHGDICLRYRPQLIAVSCVYLSLMLCKAEVPLNATAKVPWWKVCHESATKQEIVEVVDSIVDVYNLESKCRL